ncbi:phage major capsid protein, partial [Schaalia turicensis]|uniref:phage major capsid protein n=1 Tax=Schaalia turicensis TaxID=131111 RepID=UPI0034A46E51
STHGTAGWLDEGKPYTESDEAFTQVNLSAFKLGTFLKISEELLNDAAFNVEQYLAVEFARRIGAAEEEAFLTGDGKGKPTGIFTASGGGEKAVTAGKATDITADELIDLHYGLRAPYRKNAVWLMNDSTVKTIRKLKDGNGQYLWQPALTAGTPDLVLGRPVHTSTFVPEIKAGASTVAFGDLSYYWIADRQGRSFKRLNELFATTGQVGFLASQRLDGKLVLPEAVKLLTQKAGA